MKSPLLSEFKIPHHFGSNQSPQDPLLQSAWEKSRPRFKQVRGNRVVWYSKACEEIGECDAIFTEGESLPAGVVTADCVPILLSTKDGKKIGAIHAGWEGMLSRIVTLSIGENPKNWIASIGPAIGPCCYQIGEDLMEKFYAEFQGILPVKSISPSHRMLDLPAIAEAELKKAGVGLVELNRSCTRCTRDDSGEYLYFSHRRQPGEGRQLSVILRIP